MKLAKLNSAWLKGVKEVNLMVGGAFADKVASDAAYTLTHAGLRVYQENESGKFRPTISVMPMVRGFLGKKAICHVLVTYNDYATRLDNPMAHGVVQVVSLERVQSGVQLSKSNEALQQMSSQVIKDFATLYMDANLSETTPPQ
ncbi:MAG: hypothetical protein K2W95_32765 [Candidatus Obscuribacterales bacterium]|nr:hypothetical protein [Candidatus Obscuribacterales bacterium]